MTPLLLLHGFTGSPDSWGDVRALLPPNLRITAPFLSGHGVPPAALSVARFADEVERLLALAEPNSLIAGYSLGARLGLALALRAPERFKAVLLVSGSPGLRDEAEREPRRQRDAALCALLEQRGLEAFVDHWEREPLFASQALLPESTRRAERARRLGHSASGLCHSLRVTGLAEMPSSWSALATLRLPVEILVGELDQRFRAVGAAVTAALPNARLTCVPGAGHNLLLERPEAVKDAISRGISP